MKIRTLLILALLVAMGQATWAQTQPIDLSTGPFTEGFENGIGDWTVPASGSIHSSIGHGSASSFHFYQGPTTGSYLISPELTGTENGINLQFYYTNYYKETTSFFKVGYSTTTNSVEAFTWSELITANQGTMPSGGNQGWIMYDYDFPSGIKYVAIAYQKSYHLFVDDFNITALSGGCPEPTMPTISNVGNNSMTVNWTGNNDSYELRYRQLAFFSFEDGVEPWTTIDADGDGYSWEMSNPLPGSDVIYGSYGEGTRCVYSESVYQAYTPNYGWEPKPRRQKNYLVSPQVQLGGSISFYAKVYDAWGPNEHFSVAVSTASNTDTTDFVTIQTWDAELNWTKYTVDLSNYSGLGYVAIRHFYVNADNPETTSALLVDAITLFTPEDEWITEPVAETSLVLENLMHETPYGVQVRGICGENEYTPWSDMAIKTTNVNSNAYKFVNAGSWNVGENWENGYVPADGSNVTIAANATIPDECIANVGDIAMKYGVALTIEEGGQLKHNTVGVPATVKKSITPYENANGNDHYYLLASPMANEVNVANNTNLANNNYDLYIFDQNEDLEWLNFEANEFDALTNKTGYLYANNQALTATITGQLMPSNDVEVSLDYNSSAVMKGWNLIGNPFMCDAYLNDGSAFYRMNAAGNGFVTATGVIAPMEGFFVKSTSANHSVTISREQPAKRGQINMSLFNRNQQLDNAIVVFGDGNNLGKFSFHANSSKVYIPMEGDDYAALFTTDQMGEMPVSFKASENGNYTLSFDNENVEFAYLHLIDNLNGNDVNLLQTPSYSFDAKTTDYACRFKLVFATGNNTEDNFAFFSNGSFVISNQGEATLQVVDVMGRLLKSETINGSTSVKVNAAPGVYMLRLVNGSDVKVQKVMVK